MDAKPPFPTVPYPRVESPRREKEMKVLALGMSRTGTTSLYVALKELGYLCYHGSECALDTENGSLTHWNRAMEAKYNGKGQLYKTASDFGQMLWRYQAVSDIPSILFAEELMDAYPNAQIILTNRDVGSWRRSIEHAFYPILESKRYRFLELFDTTWARPYLNILRFPLNIWTNGNWRNRDRLESGFATHYKHVREAAKARNRPVLEFRVQDGWAPLCRFLGKDEPAPDRPFPHANEGDWIARYHMSIFWFILLGKLQPVLLSGLIVLVALGGAWWVKS